MHEDGQTREHGVARTRLQTLLLKRPRCPRCKSIALKKYRSIRDQGDGTGLSWYACTRPGCGQRFKVLHE